MTQIELFSGQNLKHRGVESVLMHQDDAFKFLVKHMILLIANRKGWVTSDDLQDFLDGEDIEPTHQNAIGAMFSSMSREGLIVDTRISIRTRRPSGHARKISVWALPGHNRLDVLESVSQLEGV